VTYSQLVIYLVIKIYMILILFFKVTSQEKL